MSPSLESRENRAYATETKFLISPDVAEQVRKWARARLGPDSFASGQHQDAYLTTSLYFDTDSFDVYRRNGSFGRSKYRIRRYGSAEAVFVERKLKTRNMVAKRRSLIAIDELPRIEEYEAERGWAGYWFHRRLLARDLKAVCQISYQRTARVSMSDYGPIRLTLDHDVRAMAIQTASFAQNRRGALILPDKNILELKYCYQMPVLFKKLIEELKLQPHAMSKYRLAAASLGLASKPAAGVMLQAPNAIYA